MAVEFLCSVHGTLIYFDVANNCLAHGGGRGLPHNAALMTEDGESWLVCRTEQGWQRLDGLNAAGHIGLAAPIAAPFRLHGHKQPGDLLSFEANGVWLCAESDGTVTFARQSVGPWETFFPMSEADHDFLLEIGGQSWIASGGGLVRNVGDVIHGIRFETDFGARIGLLRIPVRDLLASRHRRFKDGWSVVFDNWRVEYLTPFKPLIYTIAYGKDEIFETLGLLLQSLHEFGHYGGDILIFSDRTLEQLQPIIPPALAARARVATAPVRDVTDMMAIKYRICDMPELSGYRPLLYLDADVICNAPLDRLLGELSRASRVSVPLEMDLKGNHNYYGGVLFNLDPTAPIRNERGFSAGLMGIPCTEVARQSFPVILESLYGLTRQQKDRSVMASIFQDQGVANYVMHKTDAADFDIMTRHVTTPVGFDRPLTEIPRLGLAHFCGGIGDAGRKLPSMRAYLALLRNTS